MFKYFCGNNTMYLHILYCG